MILSIDLGTSSIKGAVFLETRPLRNLQRVVYKRQDATGWIDALEQLISQLSLLERSDLESIVISGQGPTIVPVLNTGRALKPIFYYQTQGVLPEDKEPVKSYFLPKVAAFLKKNPHYFYGIRYFFSAPDYLVYWLTGEAVTSLPNSEYESLVWARRESDRYHFPDQWFPPYATSQPIHYVRKSLKDTFFFQRNVMVYSTLFDFISATLGSGAIDHGDVFNRAGMSEGVNFIMNKAPLIKQLPKTDAIWRITPHFFPDLYNVGVVFDAAASTLEQHSYDPQASPVQEHVSKVVKVWNDMKLFPIERIRLCGGQTNYPEITKLKQSLSKYPIHTLNYPQAELMGNAMYGAWQCGYHATLVDSIEYFMEVMDIP